LLKYTQQGDHGHSATVQSLSPTFTKKTKLITVENNIV